MMNNDMTGLLNLAYEIEGLLLLQINRGDEAAPEMKELLVRKAENLLSGLRGNAEAGKPADDWLDISPEMKSVAEILAKEPERRQEKVAENESEEAPVMEAENADEAIASSVSFEEEADADSEVAPEPAISTAEPEVNIAEPSAPLTLDEKLARERAADISKAFTLNDKFRFCRELFRNSNDEFKETLEVIGSMADMDEAEEYFYNDLCWDPEKEEVKEFMAIVAKHF